jgi:hypothetical protein
MDGGFAKYLEGMDEKEIQVIVRFIEKVEDFLKRRIDSEI